MRLLGLAARGLGPQVRVRVDYALWATDPLAADRRADRAADPQSAPYNVYDKVLTLDGEGHLTVPIRRMERLNGYRITVQPVSAPAVYAGRYQAEDATGINTVPHLGSDTALASGRGYVGGIDRADSSVGFTVEAARAGIHVMTVRYANGTTGRASHTVTVGGERQGDVDYAPTGGWANSTMRTTTARVVLKAGTNTVTLAKAPATRSWTSSTSVPTPTAGLVRSLVNSREQARSVADIDMLRTNLDADTALFHRCKSRGRHGAAPDGVPSRPDLGTSCPDAVPGSWGGSPPGAHEAAANQGTRP
ncbi:hypothetical protein [Streptomyces sp. NPDC086010]|uniref:hypothetical protein n=1 Tax=Streptomyces sp. NPDC086010 TaxID=3365745 RepID=UPI0037D281F8